MNNKEHEITDVLLFNMKHQILMMLHISQQHIII